SQQRYCSGSDLSSPSSWRRICFCSADKSFSLAPMKTSTGSPGRALSRVKVSSDRSSRRGTPARQRFIINFNNDVVLCEDFLTNRRKSYHTGWGYVDKASSSRIG